MSILLQITEKAIPPPPVEMADAMRADGKIYVVVGVIAIVFVALAIYLWIIDRKITKLEQEYKENSKAKKS